MPGLRKAKSVKRERKLASRPDYKSALETLERFAKMMGGELTKPSGIVRRSAHGQWQSTPLSYPSESTYPSGGRDTAK